MHVTLKTITSARAIGEAIVLSGKDGDGNELTVELPNRAGFWLFEAAEGTLEENPLVGGGPLAGVFVPSSFSITTFPEGLSLSFGLKSGATLSFALSGPGVPEARLVELGQQIERAMRGLFSGIN